MNPWTFKWLIEISPEYAGKIANKYFSEEGMNRMSAPVLKKFKQTLRIGGRFSKKGRDYSLRYAKASTEGH